MLTYTIATAGIGVAQVIDAAVLIRARGRLNRFSLIFSFFEYVWAAVSIAVLWQDRYAPSWYPISYLAFLATMVSLTFVVGLEGFTDGDEIRIPLWLLYLGGAFGLWFAGAGIWILDHQPG